MKKEKSIRLEKKALNLVKKGHTKEFVSSKLGVSGAFIDRNIGFLKNDVHSRLTRNLNYHGYNGVKGYIEKHGAYKLADYAKNFQKEIL